MNSNLRIIRGGEQHPEHTKEQRQTFVDHNRKDIGRMVEADHARRLAAAQTALQQEGLEEDTGEEQSRDEEPFFEHSADLYKKRMEIYRLCGVLPNDDEVNYMVMRIETALEKPQHAETIRTGLLHAYPRYEAFINTYLPT